MKRSSQPRATAELSKSLNQQLNTYALAAGAAGVSLLALAKPAAAKIIYTPAHAKVGQLVSLDLNHDGSVDFYLVHSDAHGSDALAVCQHWLKAGSSITYCSPYSGTNAIRTGGDSKGGRFAAALRYGERIQRGEQFAKRIARLGILKTFETASSTRWYGPWLNRGKGVKNRYLGLEFKINGRFHFGWARINVTTTKFDFTATLTGYAYETIPGKAIVAGKTKGSDVITVSPASLGHLAAGASAIPAWRVKQTAATTH
jgi:hypothetical protein